jgi:hypothetical protein
MRMTARVTLPSRPGTKLEVKFTLEIIHELCAFVAREISFSKVKYDKIAEKAGV